MIEFLIALSVAGVLTGAALTLTLSSRGGYSVDQQRTHVNQNLRASLNLLGIEIRQAGERLPGDVPAIELADGGDGSPDTLILRRNLIGKVLPLCGELSPGEIVDEIQVADEGDDPPPGCAALGDEDGNGWPDNIDAWRNMRDAQGGAIWAFVYDPVDRQGDYFLFNHDNTTTSEFLGRGDDKPWSRTYGVNEQCRIYFLEQRRFQLVDGVLQFELNQDAQNDIHLGSDVVDFQVQAILTDGTVLDDLDQTGDWTDLRAVQVTLTGEAAIEDQVITRTISARFFPRNILSN